MKKESSDSVVENVSTSICMATFNGERYLPEQMESVLAQMSKSDELVIVDDASNDNTLDYLRSLDDERIRIFRNSANIGHVQSFAKAIELARGKFILMADQDDIWLEGRLQAIIRALAHGSAVVSSNSEFVDNNGGLIPPLHPDLHEADSQYYLKNIVRIFLGTAYYDGCSMGLRKEFKKLVLPIPKYVESHDLWIAMAANLAKSNLHLSNYTLRRRVHGGNASIVSRSLLKKIVSRCIFLLSLLHISLRLIRLSIKIQKTHS